MDVELCASRFAKGLTIGKLVSAMYDDDDDEERENRYPPTIAEVRHVEQAKGK